MDIDNCFCGEDLFGSLQRYFERASQILLALSPDYAETICSDNEHERLDQRTQLKRSLHQMTFQEVFLIEKLNKIYFRFSIIVVKIDVFAYF